MALNIINAVRRLRLKQIPEDELLKKISDAYLKGVNDATEELIGQVKKLEKQVNDLMDAHTREKNEIKKDYEGALREYDSRMKEKCNRCQKTTTDERTYLRNMQSIFSIKLKKLDYMFSRIKEYLGEVKDHHTIIMLEAGKVSATDHIVLQLERDFQDIAKDSDRLLSTDTVEHELIERYTNSKKEKKKE